jgi:hypothetical protein
MEMTMSRVAAGLLILLAVFAILTVFPGTAWAESPARTPVAKVETAGATPVATRILALLVALQALGAEPVEQRPFNRR